jgi:hypothetical protein
MIYLHPSDLGVDSHMSERTVDAGRAITHRIYPPTNRWTESDPLDPMFEKPQKAQIVRIKIEPVSLDSTSVAPSLDRPRLAQGISKDFPGESSPLVGACQWKAASLSSADGHGASVCPRVPIMWAGY